MKVRMEEIEKQLDLVPKLIKISLQIGIGVGALIILVYCGGVGYYPSGLTIGDGLLFIAVALSFGFSYSILVLFLFCTAVALTPFWRIVQIIAVHSHRLWLKIRGQTRQEEQLAFPPLTADQFGIAVIGIVGSIFIIISFFKDIDLFIGLISSIALIALCYLLFNSTKINESDSEQQKAAKKRVKLAFAVAIYLIPLFVGRFQGSVLDQTMHLIGVRTEVATVQFKKDYKEFVDLTLNLKSKESHQVTVLFNGFGTSSVIELEKKRFVVPNDQYFLVYE